MMIDGQNEVNPVAERKKKPYVPPQIVSREQLEVMAATCSPRPPAKANAGMCSQGPINS